MSGQIVHLFRGTIRENIALGKLGASETEIVAAAKAAHAHDFIMGFPAGYDTPVGEHGMQLSGGQRQRIAIARALVKDAPIILLDEATASLDSESERHVQEAIAELCKGRTTLVIAHRLSTIMHADCILVVENGRSSNPAATTNCCARAAVMPRSTGCNSRSSRRRRSDRSQPLAVARFELAQFDRRPRAGL